MSLDEVDREWRKIADHPDYEVSNLGEVRSIKRGIVTAITPHPVTGGHVVARLSTAGKVASPLIHRLVLAAFIGEGSPGQVACHNDGDPQNNVVTNLRWDTQSENCLDAVRQGTHVQARKTECPQKHPYAGENLRVSGGQRYCATCKREAGRRKRQGQREAAARDGS